MNKLIGKFKMGIDIIKNCRNWINIFLNYFKVFRDNPLKIKLRNGKIIKLERNDKKEKTFGLSTIWEIFFMENYTKNKMKINKGDVVIDIGANIGIFTIYSYFEGGEEIYAFEPFPKHFSRLKNNLEINKVKAKIFPLGISNKTMTNEFYVSDCSGRHSLKYKTNKKIKINCISLNELFEKNKIDKCDLLKIDAEGSEYDILYNATDETLKKIKKITLEWENVDERDNVFQLEHFLKRRGFNVVVNKKFNTGILYAFLKGEENE